MRHIRRKITLAVLGTMLIVFLTLLTTVNVLIPEYLTAEARKAILLEDERKSPVPFDKAKDEEEEDEDEDEDEEHFLTPSVR